MTQIKVKNYGFITPKITADNHVLGGAKTLGKEILNPERDWLPFLPIGESQRRKFDTYSCPEFGTLNAIDTLANRKGYSIQDASERALAIVAKNSPQGNDPHTVAQAIRHFGLNKEASLPFDDSLNSWEEYMIPDPLTPALVKEGEKWLTEYDFGHEWVFTRGTVAYKQKKLLEALQYGTVCVSVRAWKKKGSLYVKDIGEPDTHWVHLATGEEEKPWMVNDSYDEGDKDFIKELDWNYDFGFAKLYTLNKITKKKCFLSKWLN